MSKDIRTLFMGMPGPFSRIVLERLLANDIGVDAVLLSGQGGVPLRTLFLPGPGALPYPGEGLELPLLNDSVAVPVTASEASTAVEFSSRNDATRAEDRLPASLAALAFHEGIPAYEIGEIGHPEVTDWFAQSSFDVVCVACWNRIIPPSVLDIPMHGFLNVHPSILPAYRGPYPLFWQYREGETATGVTVHWMDAGLDTGDIAGQREIAFEAGIRGSEAEAQCARSGGDLLSEVLLSVAKGEARRRPQPAGGSYFPAPQQEDFALDANWHPLRAFNFMRANAEWGIPFRLEAKGSVHWLADALEWKGEGAREAAGEGKVWVSFRGGHVRAEEYAGEAI